MQSIIESMLFMQHCTSISTPRLSRQNWVITLKWCNPIVFNGLNRNLVRFEVTNLQEWEREIDWGWWWLSCWDVSLLARSFLPSSEWSFVDGCSTLLDVMYTEEEEQQEFLKHKKNYVWSQIFFFLELCWIGCQFCIVSVYGPLVIW